FFEASKKAGQQAVQSEIECEPNSPELLKYIEEDQQKTLIEELELVVGAIGEYNKEDFLAGKLTPVMFGSARNNFGISVFLDFFSEQAPGPQSKPAQPAPVNPQENRFSSFVFKIQANMDKAHRDRIAFVRICSGAFERDMNVNHAR